VSMAGELFFLYLLIQTFIYTFHIGRVFFLVNVIRLPSDYVSVFLAINIGVVIFKCQRSRKRCWSIICMYRNRFGHIDDNTEYLDRSKYLSYSRRNRAWVYRSWSTKTIFCYCFRRFSFSLGFSDCLTRLTSLLRDYCICSIRTRLGISYFLKLFLSKFQYFY